MGLATRGDYTGVSCSRLDKSSLVQSVFRSLTTSPVTPEPDSPDDEPTPNPDSPDGEPTPNPDSPNEEPAPNPDSPTTTRPNVPPPGTSIEVYWDEDEVWYPCIIKDAGTDDDGSWVSLCAYDDAKKLWHNLEHHKYRTITPTLSRVRKLTVAELRQLLRQARMTFRSETRKDALVQTLFQYLCQQYDDDTAATDAVVVTGGATTATTDAMVVTGGATTATTITTVNVETVREVLQVRSKLGQTHAARMMLQQSQRERNETAPERQELLREHTCAPNPFLTATQTCQRIWKHAEALRVLTTRGDAESYSERDKYNFITINQSDLIRWGSEHVWQIGDKDMTLLPEAITAIRDVRGWEC